MKDKLTLLHFDNPQDLLAGIETLQQHNIVIREVYSAVPIPGIEAKLRIKQLQLGAAIFKFGCLGGIGLMSIGYYLLQQHINWPMLLLNAIFLLLTVLIASRLFSVSVPTVISLKPGDMRYLAVVDTQRIPVNESVTYLFQYAGAFKFSPAIKNIVIS